MVILIFLFSAGVLHSGNHFKNLPQTEKVRTMHLSDIMTDLENYGLEVEETVNAAGNLRASVIYFFEQVKEGSVWTVEQLESLKEKCQITRSLEMIETALEANQEREEN